MRSGAQLVTMEIHAARLKSSAPDLSLAVNVLEEEV